MPIKKRYVFLIFISLIINGCNSEDNSLNNVKENEIRSIQITFSPKTKGISSYSIAKGNCIKFIATAIYLDNSSVDVTKDVIWKSEASNVLAIDSKGEAKGKDIGSSKIQASIGNVHSNAVNIEVTDAIITSIQITPSAASLAKGQTQPLTATAIFSDDTSFPVTESVTWKSEDTNIATVTNKGVLNANNSGIVEIFANKDGVTSNAVNIEVTDAIITSIQITPSAASLAKGQTQPLTATAIFSDDTSFPVTESVTWKSEDTNIATVTNKGVLNAINSGIVEIFANKDGVTSNAVNIEVTDAIITSIQITPSAASLAKGQTQPLTATAIFSDDTSFPVTESVTWKSEDTNIATVTNKGVLNAINSGIVEIFANKDGVTSNAVNIEVTDAIITSIQITPSAASLAKGQTQPLTATAIFSDDTSFPVTESVTWKSEDTNIATVTNKGVLNAINSGIVEIFANKDGVTSNAVNIEVTDFLSKHFSIDVYDTNNNTFSSREITQSNNNKFNGNGFSIALLGNEFKVIPISDQRIISERSQSIYDEDNSIIGFIAEVAVSSEIDDPSIDYTYISIYENRTSQNKLNGIYSGKYYFRRTPGARASIIDISFDLNNETCFVDYGGFPFLKCSDVYITNGQLTAVLESIDNGSKLFYGKIQANIYGKNNNNISGFVIDKNVGNGGVYSSDILILNKNR
ncbi:Ig-like domain-containing protein [Vibrio vulnificus]|uniref:Ig-like domain-containing protein n=9 Tax=Vibrionaceae TaxID=641 RepID=UPI00192D633B|nr:Ig-like domain-containing protein [Vibrio vulnificus]MBL6181838.1 Ig-like domain-containing protein [Vibrio vulnificus]